MSISPAALSFLPAVAPHAVFDVVVDDEVQLVVGKAVVLIRRAVAPFFLRAAFRRNWPYPLFGNTHFFSSFQHISRPSKITVDSAPYAW
jgi:hypothetical protein